MSTNGTLNFHGSAASGPVDCLGQRFPNDAARREHFLRILAEKLQDPEFREQDGFPNGSDEAILAMSNPPYYTACPNPWVEEFGSQFSAAAGHTNSYIRNPFVADVSEGKMDPIY